MAFAVLAIALPGSLRPSFAAEPGDGVAVISVPPPTPPAAASPKLEAAADLTRFFGKPITKIDVSLDDDTWTIPDLPKVTSVRPGQMMSGGSARRAMEDVLDSGRFARARVVSISDGTGVRLVVHVAQRAIDSDPSVQRSWVARRSR